MSRDPDGLIHVCARCRKNTELTHVRDIDEYLCDDCREAVSRCATCDAPLVGPGIYDESTGEFICNSCKENALEAAYDRHQEWLMETGGGPSLLEQQNAARKLK